MITVIGDDGPREQWHIEVSDDEPDEVRTAAAAITDEVQRGVRGKPKTATLVTALQRSRDEARRNGGRPTDKMRKAMHALANELGLSRQDRLDLAEMVLEHDCASWGELGFEDASRMLTAMNGYLYIRHLRTRK